MIIVKCAECTADIDITHARGPDSGGDYHCTDTDACDTRFTALLEAVDAI